MEAELREFEELKNFMKDVFRGKKAATGFWDPDVLVWWAPRVVKYWRLPPSSDERTALQESLIQEFFQRFPDTHPDVIKFKNPEAAHEYLKKIRNFIHGKCNILGTKAQVADEPSAAFKNAPKRLEDVIINLYQTSTSAPMRAHDHWAKNGPRKEWLKTEFEQRFQEKLREVGTKQAWADRMADLQAFRIQEFMKMKEEDRNPWYDAVEGKVEEYDQSEWLLKGLPVLWLMADTFSEKSGCPIFIATGAESLDGEGMAEVFT